MPFGDSLAILALMATVLICSAALVVLAYRLFTRKRLSILGWLVVALSLIPLIALIFNSIIVGDIEYNPSQTSIDLVAGTYAKGNQSIRLARDGTYTSKNLDKLRAGEWSNYDWNLTFSNSDLTQARIVTRNGRPCILPYYSGVDGPDGLLLTKQESEQAGTEQPATRSQSKSEGSDQPQPELEGRSR